jgi:beta-glucosidase
LFWFALASAFLLAQPAPAIPSEAEVNQKVDSLISQMTLDEKIGQMTQVDLLALTNKIHVKEYAIGSVLSGGDSDPTDNAPGSWLQACVEVQELALQSRLKVPILYGIDAVHGHNNVDGAVVFPHNIGLGATHNADLVERAAQVTASEIAGTSMHWAFAPCVAVAQDIRWGRTYESFGEDPEIAAMLGAAAVRGFQKPLPSGLSVLACAKHYAGDGGTRGGIDQGNTVCDEATLKKLHISPYEECIKSGVGSVMVSYSSWNGEKLHGHKHLITDVLKGELGFKGFVVSDWAAIDQLDDDYKKCIEKSVNAGLDMVMIPNGPGKKNNYIEFITLLKELVAEKRVPESRIDDAARRILTQKVKMGLFENPYGQRNLFSEIGSTEHRKVARECVRQSLVLLKNHKSVLPLSKRIPHVTVLGAAADDLGVQCGGWTIQWQGSTGTVMRGGTTILQGIRKSAGPNTQVTYSRDGKNLSGADAIILVVGEKPYAEMKGDKPDLSIPAEDLALAARAAKSGVPVITVLLSGRPLVLGSLLDHSTALIAAWLPGTEGSGVADMVFGYAKPTGKLPRMWPADNKDLVSNRGGAKPLFPAGFGLSYE